MCVCVCVCVCLCVCVRVCMHVCMHFGFILNVGVRVGCVVDKMQEWLHSGPFIDIKVLHLIFSLTFWFDLFGRFQDLPSGQDYTESRIKHQR